jgi:DNA-binding transcriptional LysR family regulator
MTTEAAAAMTSPTGQGWTGIEPRHLATFATVAEARSFRLAARRLGYVQSAVSQQIAQLERTLGQQLVDRSRGGHELMLTPAGHRLLVHARRITNQVRSAAADVASVSGAATVRLAVEPALVGLLPRVIGHVADAPAGLSVSDVAAVDQPKLIACGAIDFGLGAFTDLVPGLREWVLTTDRWVLATRAGEQPHALTALQDAPLIETRAYPAPSEVTRLAAHGVLACDRIAIAIDLVRAGAGHAVLPALALTEHDPALQVLELDRWVAPRIVSLIWLEARRHPRELIALSTTRPAAGHAPQWPPEAAVA